MVVGSSVYGGSVSWKMQASDKEEKWVMSIAALFALIVEPRW